MSDAEQAGSGKVEALPSRAREAVVSSELNRVLDLLCEEFPEAANIHFEFNRRLFVHIDVRNREEVTLLEARLPKIGGGMFSQVRHSGTPGHAFLRRVSALVDR